MKKTHLSILCILFTIATCSNSVLAQTSTWPVVSIVATTPNASEDGLVPGVFTVSLSKGIDTMPGFSNAMAMRVFYRIGGSALNGRDYQTISNWVAVSNGTTSAEIVIQPLADNLREGSETVVLQLVPTPLNSGPPYLIGTPSDATVTIADSTQPPTNFPPVVRLASPTNGAVFPVPADVPILADARDVDGYVATVEFFAGDKSLGITTNNPYSMTPINPFHLLWTNVPVGSYTLTAVATDDQGASSVSAPVQITVTDQPQPPPQAVVSIYATDPYGSEIPPVPPGMGMPQRIDPAVFTVARTGETNFPLTVFYKIGGTASNGVDYTMIADSVVIPTGARTAEIVIMPIDDNLVEGIETVILTVQPPICLMIWPPPPECYLVGRPSQATAYILDDDTVTNQVPVVTIVASDPNASEGGPDTGTFTVTRTGQTDLPLRVFYFTGGTAQNGIDYMRLSNYVVIPAGAAAADIIVTPIDDSLVEGPETVKVQLRPAMILYSDPTGLQRPSTTTCLVWPSPYIVGSPSNAVVTITDNDTSGTNIWPAVRIVRPMEGSIFRAPAMIGLVADARDLDGSIASVEFFEGANSLGFGTYRPLDSTPIGQYFLLWSNVTAGKYTLTALATDNQGATSTSLPVHVSVIATNPPPPTNTVPIVSITAVDPIAAEGRLDFPTTVIVQSNLMSSTAVGYCTSGSWVRSNSCDSIYWTNIFCGTNTATFEVRRCGSTNSDLTVYYNIGGTASNGVDYVALPGSVTIPAGRRAARIVVVPIDDTEVETIETVILGLTLPPDSTSSSAPSYIIGVPGRAAALILDNDYAPPITPQLVDRSLHIFLQAASGCAYRVEMSSDLVNWTACQTNITPDAGIHYIDPDTTMTNLRFYRIVPEPLIVPEE